MTRRQKRRVIVASAIALAVASLLTVLFLDGRFVQFQRQLSDVLFLTKARSPQVSRFVVIVGLDDKSTVELRRYGRVFNWPRSLHAQLVHQLTEARARAIMFDVLFDAPSDTDDELAQAFKVAQDEATNIVLAAAGDPLTKRETARGRLEWYGDTFEPLPTFKELVSGIGMANQLPDPDGTIRRVPLVLEAADELVPTLPLITAAKFLRRPQAWDGPIENGAVPLAGRMIPIDDNGAIIVNYAGGPHESAPPAFPVVSFVDVLNGRVPPETFERKLVLVGLTATGFADDYWTPPSISGKMDGVEIQANAIDTILRSEFLRDSPVGLTIALIFGFAALAGVTLVTLSPLLAALIGALALAIFAVAASAYFDNGGVILNMVYPPLSLFLAFGGIMLHRIIFEQGQTRAMRGVLGQYLSPAVVTEVTRDPDSLKLGGDQREMTVLFSDLRNFTSFSESLDPETVVQTLCSYLTAMSDVIFKYQGTIDKYIGDSVMAFWGAPTRQPNHAALACQAALEMADALDELNRQWLAEARRPLAMGIGINTGVMKVGNMGSSSRFDYTVMGDAVNLGSRLEALNKEYGTTLIVSGATLRASENGFRSRFIDLVAVKGKNEPVEVFELIRSVSPFAGDAGEALRAYNAGIEAYRERDWLLAAARFQEALRFAPNDGPSALYLERCQRLMEDPPPADWDGVFVMTHK